MFLFNREIGILQTTAYSLISVQNIVDDTCQRFHSFLSFVQAGAADTPN